MFDFEKVCRDVEEMDPLTYSIAISSLSAKVIDELSTIKGTELSGLSIYSGLLLGAVVSDGEISEDEFALIHPMIELALDQEITLQDANALLKYLKPDCDDYKVFVNDAADLFAIIDEDLKTNIVTICLLVCGIDGKISRREKKWLKKLLK